MTAPRRITLTERVDLLALRVLTLESIAGFDKIEGALLQRIEADREAEAPPKASRRRRGDAL